MQRLWQASSRFARDQRGTTAIEYGLIAALVAVGALVAMIALGSGLQESWGNTAEQVGGAMNGQ